MTAMDVVDTHFHLWTAETHPWVVKLKDGGHPVGKFGKKSNKRFTESARTDREPDTDGL